jgi:methylmalonyl-CoA/ethylmalonyl-CoA epimerase
MSIGTKKVCHIAFVVKDIHKTVENWCKILGIEETPRIWNLSKPDEVPAYTDGMIGDYSDVQICAMQLDNVLLEITQPGNNPSPWKDFLDKNGEGVQHISFIVPDAEKAYKEVEAITGVDNFYHIGYYPGGGYAFFDTKAALGCEINIKDEKDYTGLIAKCLANPDKKLDDILNG